jgi:hypothetical protein
MHDCDRCRISILVVEHMEGDSMKELIKQYLDQEFPEGASPLV